MEDLKSQLKFLSEIEVKEIIEEAKNQASKLVNDARAKAEQIKNKESEGILQKAREMEILELETARMKGKRKLMNARYRLVDEVLKKSLDSLNEMAERQDSVYKKSIEKLVVEAATTINGTEFEVVVNSRDVKFVRQKLAGIEKKVSAAKNVHVTLKIGHEPLRASGGAVVVSGDGKQIFNNTLEARLAKVQQEMLPAIGDMLLGGAGT